MLYSLFKYLSYFFEAQNQHGLHSPFVYKLYTEVIKDTSEKVVYSEIEAIRQKLLNDNSEYDYTDFGAKGSSVGVLKKRKINKTAGNVLKSAKYGKLLYRLSHYFKPQNMLELGTSFGVSTSYQKSGSPDSVFYTLEGCPNTLKIAQKYAPDSDINYICGNFSETLPQVLNEVTSLDWVFIDGNHAYGPTIDYFLQILPKLNNNSVVILDDIYWSKGMTKAWEEIKNHPSVTVTVNLYAIGLVFFRKEQAKEHFILRF